MKGCSLALSPFCNKIQFSHCLSVLLSGVNDVCTEASHLIRGRKRRILRQGFHLARRINEGDIHSKARMIRVIITMGKSTALPFVSLAVTTIYCMESMQVWFLNRYEGYSFIGFHKFLWKKFSYIFYRQEGKFCSFYNFRKKSLSKEI